MLADMVCPVGVDNQFGPRVAVNCREYDFTLLFEDAFFSALPAALLLIGIGPRLYSLHNRPLKVTSQKLAVLKLVS